MQFEIRLWYFERDSNAEMNDAALIACWLTCSDLHWVGHRLGTDYRLYCGFCDDMQTSIYYCWLTDCLQPHIYKNKMLFNFQMLIRESILSSMQQPKMDRQFLRYTTFHCMRTTLKPCITWWLKFHAGQMPKWRYVNHQKRHKLISSSTFSLLSVEGTTKRN